MIAECQGDVQRVVDEMKEMLRTSEMKINWAKTKISVCARDPKIKANLHITSKKIEKVHDMAYLGSKITSDGKSTQ